MRTRDAGLHDIVEIDELDLLTDMLMLWCRENNRQAEELLPKCGVILERYRSGIFEPELLFEGL